MVDYLSDVAELVRGLRRYAFSGDAPAEIEEQLQKLLGTDADVLTAAPEILYAHYDQLDGAGKRVLGEMFVYGNEKGWTTFAGGAKGSGNRAEQIIQQVGRDLGDEGAIKPAPAEQWPKPQLSRRSDGADWRAPAAAPDVTGVD